MLVLLIMGCCSTETTRDRENSDVCSDNFINLLVGNDFKFLSILEKRWGANLKNGVGPTKAVQYLLGW